MKRVVFYIIVVCAISVPAFGVGDGDMEIFSDCTSTVEPNVLIMMDTSFSMHEMDVYDAGIPVYDRECDYCNKYLRPLDIDCKNGWRTPEFQIIYDSDSKEDIKWKEEEEVKRLNEIDRIFYKFAASWPSFKSLWAFSSTIDYANEISCKEAKVGFDTNGFYEGKLSLGGGCEGYLGDPLHATANYLNYKRYVDHLSKKPNVPNSVTFKKGNPGTTYDDDDLVTYNPDTDYYRYITNRYTTDPQPLIDAGYGSYETDASYDKKEDRVYVDMGMIRPYSSVFHPDGIKVENLKCDVARTSLLQNGWAYEKVYETNSCNCVVLLQGIAFRKLLMTRNFLNFLQMKKSRSYNAINAVHNVAMSKISSVRFGIMQFDLDSYIDVGELKWYKSHGGDLAMPCQSEDVNNTAIYNLRKVLFERYDYDYDYDDEDDAPEQFGQPLYFGHNGMIGKDISKDTPLAETLVEVGLYFSGQASWFNTYDSTSGWDTFFDSSHSVNEKLELKTDATSLYKSPIECPGQVNKVVIITDGNPEDDFEANDTKKNWITNHPFAHFDDNNEVVGTKIGDYDDDGADCILEGCTTGWGFNQTWLDDVANFLYLNDMSPLDDTQNIETTAISFRMHADAKNTKRDFLNRTATIGGGDFFEAQNQKALEYALIAALKGLVKSSTFSSAVTPVRQDDLTYSGDKIFLTAFKISDTKRGQGNIRKFHRDGDTIQGKLDGSGEYVSYLGPTGSIKPKVKDDWFVTIPDGAEHKNAPDDGAAGKLYMKILSAGITGSDEPPAQLQKIAAVRNILTANDLRTATLYDLIRASDAISIPAAGSSTGMGIEKQLPEFLLEHVYGVSQEWPLGHIVHNNVVVVNDPTDDGEQNTYIFAGANDGMFHCFDSSGNEVWAFIPPAYHSRLWELKNKTVHPFFIDGRTAILNKITHYDRDGVVVEEGSEDAASQIRDPLTIIFGERRGGYSYHMLKVDDMESPQYIGAIGSNNDEWGQSWSQPVFGRIPSGSDSWVTGFVVGGGYDVTHDETNPVGTPDTKGRFVAVCKSKNDVTLLKTLTAQGGSIDACIIGARISDIDHDVERLFSNIFAGDLRGSVYHFSDNYFLDGEGNRKIKERTLIDGTFPERRKIFKGPLMTNETLEFYQKIFYAPVLGESCNGGKIFFGTGDREHPNIKTNLDSIYAVSDQWSEDGAPAERHELMGFKMVYTHTDSDSSAFSHYRIDPYEGNPDKDIAKGWYLDLPHTGEKVISEPLVVDDTLVIGTYTPPSSSEKPNEEQENTGLPAKCSAGCDNGEGRVYVIKTCLDSLAVKSIKTGSEDPMPQPALIFDKDSGKVLISTGDGAVYDPKIPVVRSLYWKHSGSDL